MELRQNLENAPSELNIQLWDQMFHDGERNARTPVTTAFFSIANLTWLLGATGMEVSRLLNRTVVIEPTESMYTVCSQKLKYARNVVDVTAVVNAINKEIMVKEVRVHYFSLRRRELFYKWFIAEQRPRIIEPPRNTNGRFRYDRLEFDKQKLSDPDKRFWGTYLAARSTLRQHREPALFEHVLGCASISN